MHTGKDPLPPPSAPPSLHSAWRSNSELRIPAKVGEERREERESQVGVHRVFYMLLYRVELCARTNLSFESCVSVGNDLWLHIYHCMPGLVQQKRDETTWGGGGSVRVALGEGYRLVGYLRKMNGTAIFCIHCLLS